MQTAKDLTEDIRRQAALTEALIEAIAIPVAIVDNGWNLVSANARLLDIIGYPLEEILAKHLSTVCAGTGLPRLTDTGGLSGTFNASFITKKGTLVPVKLYASAIHEGIGMIAISAVAQSAFASAAEMKDGSERLSARVARLEAFREGVLQILHELDTQEAELDGAYARLAAAQAHLIQSSKLNTLGELAAGLAHELNQPVTIIKGLAQSLLKDLDAGSADVEKVRLIAEASSRMELIVRHMNVFSRSKEPELSICDLNAIIKDAFRLSGASLSQRSIEVALDLGEVPPVKGSPVRLEQVMMNLIANAKDAMKDGGRLSVRTSTLAYEKGRQGVLVSFSDTGTGIPEDALAHLFEPFFTTKEPGKGTGLGLSISRSIVRDHGGEIRVESVAGIGTTFHISLPGMPDDKRQHGAQRRTPLT